MSKTVIRVCEHETVKGLSDDQFNALLSYVDKMQVPYYTVGNHNITFHQYVGVISVGDLTIEVLPKVSGHESQDVLIDLLKYTGKIPTYMTSNSKLEVKKTSLLDLYFSLFITEVQKLIKTGLRKKYNFTTKNIKSVKGKIEFSQNVIKNYADKSKHVCRFLTFDLDNDLNRTIKLALDITSKEVGIDSLRSIASSIYNSFPESINKNISIDRINKLTTDRTTSYYDTALKLAKIIVNAYCPQLQVGGLNIMALMFDMNKLFEKFIYVALKRAAVGKYNVYAQETLKLWNNQTIRPDIVVKDLNDEIVTIIDTKWKIVENNRPSDDDLHQMFVYNECFQSMHSSLLYPGIENSKDIFGTFNSIHQSKCSLRFINLFNESGEIDINGVGERVMKIIYIPQN